MKTMSLKLMLPTEVLLETPVIKVIAEAENGSFCLLPRHIDFTAALVPGILLFTDPDGTERYGALDSGILVKCGNEVLVSAFNAVLDKDLSRLRQLVVEHFVTLDKQQQIARSALARLEAGVVRRFIEVEEHRHG